MTTTAPPHAAERPFWQAETEAGGRFRLVASKAAYVGVPGRRAPMGGVTSGAAIDAMERETGKPLIWATSHFLHPAPTETDFEIAVEIVGGGNRTPQARATVSDGSRSLLVASGALGGGESGEGRSFVSIPDVRPPSECPPVEPPAEARPGELMSQFERRLAHRDEETGAQTVWFRSVAGHPVSAGLLAILGDFLAGAHPETRGGVSLDLTLRMVATRPAEWILAEMNLVHIGEKTFQGRSRLFSECGRLLAIAGLSGLRPRIHSAER